MKVATIKIKGASPYSQSKKHNTEKLSGEGPDVYEKRTWINKGHFDSDGNMFIPPMALKKSIEEAARDFAIKIPGKGVKTYKNAFKNGIMVTEPATISNGKPKIHKDDILNGKAEDGQHWGNWLNLDANGQRGSGKRVDRCFPTVDGWESEFKVYVVNDTIPKDIFETHVEQAGKFVGIGQFRPQSGGYFGRFEVVSVKWDE